MTLLTSFALGSLVGGLIAAAVCRQPVQRVYHRPLWLRRHEAAQLWEMSEPPRHHRGEWKVEQ